MEEEKQNNAVTQTETKTEVPVTQTVEKTEAKREEKTFTQEEVNAMLAKEKGKMPAKEELQAFNEWKESQKTTEQKRQEEIIKNQNLQKDNNFKTQIIEIMKKGLDYENAEFVQFKLSKMDGDFEKNLESYMKTHPSTKEEKKSISTGFSMNKTNTVVNEDKAYLDKKYANNPYYKK